MLEDSYKDHLHPDNYEGGCGFSQFATLFPLEKMGIKVTTNNSDLMQGISHAFGTVIIPVYINGKIEEKQYLIDCTYKQFFRLAYCLKEYDSPMSNPDPGYYLENEEQTVFAKKVIEDGYFEVNENNLTNYLSTLYYSRFPLAELEKAKEDFKKFDLINIIKTKQEEYDYEESEFIRWGYNLDITSKKNTL